MQGPEVAERASVGRSEQNQRSVDFISLLRFFIPLAIVPLMIASIHSVTNAGLARMPAPEVTLAVFGVVKGITNAVKSPDLMITQMAVSLVDDGRSFRLLVRFSLMLGAVLLIILALMGYTPLGGWLLKNVIGLTDETEIAFAYTALRITCFLPVSEILRNSFHGVLIGLKQTSIMPVATTIRLALIIAFIAFAIATRAVSGMFVGGFTWTAGIGVEGIVLLIYITIRFGSPLKAVAKIPDKNRPSLAMKDMVRFFMPLGLMALIASWLHPMVQAALVRMSLIPTLTLASYEVAFGLIMILSGPVRLLHHCAIVYVTSLKDPNWPYIVRFCIGVGVACSVATLLTGVTPLGEFLMGDVIGAPDHIVEKAKLALTGATLLPLAHAIRESYWGILMRYRSTKVIGIAKGLNFAATAVSLIVLATVFGRMGLEPAVIGVLAVTTGELAESALVIRTTLKDRLLYSSS